MPATKDFWTVQDVYDLPDDGNRYETVNGELLVTPGPGFDHQFVVSRVLKRLLPYVDRHEVGIVLPAPAEVIRDTVTRMQPDVMVVPHSWLPRHRYGAVSDLLLAVEIVSPSSRRADRFTKRVEYQRQGVPLYWVVDPESRTVDVWTPDQDLPIVEREAVVWHPVGASEPLTIALQELFADLA